MLNILKDVNLPVLHVVMWCNWKSMLDYNMYTV